MGHRLTSPPSTRCMQSVQIKMSFFKCGEACNSRGVCTRLRSQVLVASCLINTEPSLDSNHSRELSSDCMPTPGDSLLYSRMQMRSHLGQKPWLAILVFLEPEGEGFSCGLADYTLLHGIPPQRCFPNPNQVVLAPKPNYF